MTPLLSRSTRALAQRNAATARVSALQRLSLVEVQRARTKADTAKQQYQTDSQLKAFREHDRERDLGSGDGGVGR